MAKLLSITVAALAAISATLPAMASNEVVTKNYIVRYSDLDLSKNSHQRILAKRINNALDYVCGRDDAAALLPGSKVPECREKARMHAEGKARIAIARANQGPQLAAAGTPVVVGN